MLPNVQSVQASFTADRLSCAGMSMFAPWRIELSIHVAICLRDWLPLSRMFTAATLLGA